MDTVYTTGDPAKSLLQYRDTASGWNLRDRTYYGMGCVNGWGNNGDGGSDIPCSVTGRIIEDRDNEEQLNGTYYHFQAATTGSGGVIETDNANAPDTFCPLGWQLPYGGTGGDYYDKSKSWSYLISQYGFGDNTPGSNGVRSYPLSYIFAGFFQANFGRLYYMNNSGIGYYWTTATQSVFSSYRIRVEPARNESTNPISKQNYTPIRCVDCFSIPHRRHGGRNCRNS